MGQLKKLLGDTAIYGASSIFGRAVNFLLVPLYTGVFQPGEYGVVTELYAYVAFLMVLYLFGVETTFFRFSTKYEDKEGYFRLAATQSFLLAVILSGLLISFSSPLANFLGYPEGQKYIIWLSLILAFDGLVAVPFARLRLEGKAKKFAGFKMLNILLNVSLNLFFLIFCPYWLSLHPESFINSIYSPEIGVGYVFLSNLVASLVTFLLFLPEWIRFRFSLDKTKWKEMIIYASPLVIMSFAGVTNEMLSRAMLRHYLPEGFYEGMTNIFVLGVFGACYKLSMLMNLSVQAFRYAYEPFYFSKSKDKNSPELFAKVMLAFVVYGCLAFMGISIILPEVAPFVLRQDAYLQALHVVPILLLGGLFLGIFYNLSVWYKITDNTKYGAIITLIGSGVTIILNIFLIRILGYEGSAIATLVAFLAMAIMSYTWGNRIYPVPYKVGRIIAYLVYSSILVFALYYLQPETMVRYVLGFSGLVLFIILVFILERKSKA